MAPTDMNAYTNVELDEVAGGLMYVAGLQGALMHLLDVTRDYNDLALIEYVNHMPTAPAAAILAAQALALNEITRRVDDLKVAYRASIDSLNVRIAEERGFAEFDEIINAEFGNDE